MNALKFGLEIYEISRKELIEKLETSSSQLSQIQSGLKPLPKSYHEKFAQLLPHIPIDRLSEELDVVQQKEIELLIAKDRAEEDVVVFNDGMIHVNNEMYHESVIHELQVELDRLRVIKSIEELVKPVFDNQKEMHFSSKRFAIMNCIVSLYEASANPHNTDEVLLNLVKVAEKLVLPQKSSDDEIEGWEVIEVTAEAYKQANKKRKEKDEAFGKWLREHQDR